MKVRILMAFAMLSLACNSGLAGVIDLGGTATGYLAVSNFKNSATQNGIEGKDSSGISSAGHNGLPDYPNYLIPAGQPTAGVWTGIIASPQNAAADYSPLYAYNGVAPGSVFVGNQTITDANHATMSAGRISYNDSLLTGSGTEVIPVSALTFNFDTYAWDGKTTGDGGPWTVAGVPSNPYYISPFSPIYTVYNDGSGAGNASLAYNISLSNVTGSGLTFVDGELASMDIDGDLTVLAKVGYVFGPSLTFTGDFSASGLDYAFDVDDTQSGFLWTGIHMVMNRAGSLPGAVPEPSAAILAGVACVALGASRRRG